MLEVRVRLNPRARRMIVKVNPATGEISVTAPSRRGLGACAGFRARRKGLDRGPAGQGAGAGDADRRARRFPSAACRTKSAAAAKGPAPVWRGRRRDLGARPARRMRRAGCWIFSRREARKAFEARALEHAARLGVKPSRITVRDTASRWGSCSSAPLAVLFLAADPGAGFRAGLCGGA